MTEQPEQLMFHGREIAMTSGEKAAMRHKLLAYTLANHSRVTAVGVAWSWVRGHAVASSVLAAVFVLGGTGVSASMAGPNDALYDFRLQVNDRIESAMAFNEDSQFDVELRQIERQLNEEEGAVDETLADDNQPEAAETSKPENLNLKDNNNNKLKNDKTSEDNDVDDADELSEEKSDKKNSARNIEDGLDVELRQMDRELQQEESATIELEI